MLLWNCLSMEMATVWPSERLLALPQRQGGRDASDVVHW
jgi:hypothetical protein